MAVTSAAVADSSASTSVGPSTQIVLPGQPIPAAYTKDPAPTVGKGCYEYQGRLLSSLMGRARRDGNVVSVIGKQEAGVVPDIESIVIGTITRLSTQQAHMSISIVDDKVVQEGGGDEFGGVIRITDIRLTERDKIKIAECFRLGDVVKAKVLSLGDARSYYLSTAANELGVVYAVSEAGNPLLPVSYQEMEDGVTGATERRKVAKPDGI